MLNVDMKILFLYSRPRREQEQKILHGKGHDNHFIGMFRLRKYDVETAYLEPEQYLGPRMVYIWRRIFNIWWMHVPFFPVMMRYDIIFAGGAYGALLLKAILGIRRPKWVIYDANITGTIADAKSFRRKVFKWAVSKADGIVALSQSEEDDLRKMFPHMAPHIHFLYEGVDTDFFKPKEAPEENYITSVGLDLGRDFKTLIEAVRGLPVQLKIASKPERIAQLGPLPENVSVRLYTHEEIQDLYARAKCVVITLQVKPEYNDSSGTYALIEARASGKAVIATKTKALVPYMRDGEDGVFVPRGDVESVRKAIVDMLADDKKRHEMGKRAREFVMEHCDAEVYAKHLHRFMSDLHADKENA